MMIMVMLMISLSLSSEYIKAQRVHSDARSDRGHGAGLLADDLAGAGCGHRHAYQDLRLYQGETIFSRERNR